MLKNKPARTRYPEIFPKDFGIELMDRLYNFDMKETPDEEKDSSYLIGTLVGIELCCENAFSLTDKEKQELREHVHELTDRILESGNDN